MPKASKPTKTQLEKHLRQAQRKVQRLEEQHGVLTLHIFKQRRMFKLLERLQHLDDTKAVCRAIVEGATDFVDCESGSIMVHDEVRNRLVIRASVGLTPQEEAITFTPEEGFAGHAWQTGEPKWSANDAEADPAFAKIGGQSTTFDALAAVPVIAGNSRVGVLNCHNKRDDSNLTEEDIDNLALLASYVGSVLQLAPLREKQRELALKDAMTGLIRRDRLPDILNERLASESASYVHCFLLDMDNFKGINDRYGHQKGDAAIAAIAKKLSELFGHRSDVLLCHWGGDEFALVMFSHEKIATLDVKQRIVDSIMESDCVELPGAKLAVSVGVATKRISETTYDDLVKEADADLYREKEKRSASWKRVIQPLGSDLVVTVSRRDNRETPLTDVDVATAIGIAVGELGVPAVDTKTTTQTMHKGS